MAQLTKSRSLEPVINAAQEWVRNCLIADNSVFSSGPLWTPENVAEVRSAFVDNPDEGKDDFTTKLKGQMAPASPSAKRLMAEMVWAILLFPSNIKVSTKRRQVGEMWSMSGEALGEGQLLLSDDVLAGIGSGGPGFNNHRWREMVFLISLVGDLKKRTSSERQKLMSNYEAFVDWIARVPQEGHRQFRHMLRFFCFPERVERMSSNRERWAVLAGFGVAQEKDVKKWSDQKLDEALLSLRKTLEGEHPGETLDFYDTPLLERWKLIEEDETKTGVKRRFWVEKTIVKNRPDRQTGENALGKALWSPQRADDGKDIYWQMRDVRVGDVVFHLVDNESLTSFSIAQSEADESFVGVTGTPWAGRPAYRIRLSDHQEIEPHIDRKEFLQEERYRSALDDLLRDTEGLFFNKKFNLNQGSYLTEAPLKLIQIWNDIHARKTQLPICKDWNIQPFESVDRPVSNQPMVLFDRAALNALSKAIEVTNFRIQEEFLERFAESLITKPFLILTGNSGTGKTMLAELFVQWLCHNASSQFAVVPVGADWTDNRNVLGFVNHLRLTNVNEAGAVIDVPVYQTTKILDLLLDAHRKENEGKPFFLILDEMNLSHVERYFSDFLSTMESKEGQLLLHREGRMLPRKQGGLSDVPESFSLPQNLFVIGTVNVDETTYMFSPKVLDRANVIEFRVDKDAPVGFLKSGGRSIGEIAHASEGYAEGFLELSLRARSVKGEALALISDPNAPPPDAKEGIEKCQATITDLFMLMQKRHQEFAFRTMTEVLRFLAVDYELKPASEVWNWKSAMDAQILQKVLPKLHGSKRKIGSLLAALAKFCEQGNRATAEVLLMDETKAEAYLAAQDKRENSPTFKESYVKLCEMMEAVRRDQFVSFIQ